MLGTFPSWPNSPSSVLIDGLGGEWRKDAGSSSDVDSPASSISSSGVDASVIKLGVFDVHGDIALLRDEWNGEWNGIIVGSWFVDLGLLQLALQLQDP